MSASEARRRGHHGMPPPPRAGEFEIVGDKCLEYVLQHATPGDAQSVVDAMDDFAYEKTWMMNIGDVKGAIVDAEIEKAKPQVMAEIGAFCGYSAGRFASKLCAVSGTSAHYYSFEFSHHFASIASKIVELAGLSDVVTFFVGPFSETYTKLKEQGIDRVDVFFMDHDKCQYLSDFKLIEHSGLLKKGAVVVADNVLSPGPGKLPAYLDYVRSNSNFTSVLHESFVEYQAELKDGVEVTTYLDGQKFMQFTSTTRMPKHNRLRHTTTSVTKMIFRPRSPRAGKQAPSGRKRHLRHVAAIYRAVVPSGQQRRICFSSRHEAS